MSNNEKRAARKNIDNDKTFSFRNLYILIRGTD